MSQTCFENSLRIMGLEDRYCRFTGTVKPVDRDLYDHDQNSRIQVFTRRIQASLIQPNEITVNITVNIKLA